MITGTKKNGPSNSVKILLAILPYWDPMIPPMGITSLKTFLQKHGYTVKTEDLIVKKECLEFYGIYFETLSKYIPDEKKGNFNNIGHDVLQSHLMAYQNYTDEKEYRELVKDLIYKSYYVEVEDSCILQINEIMANFYNMLRDYWIELLEREKPGVVGVTAYKCTIATSMFVLKLTRQNYPHIKTLMGGGTFNESHAPDSPNFQALLDASEGYLDKIILGQGEMLFLRYLRGELPVSKRVYTKEDNDGKILDFHEQELPDFSDLDMQKYPCLAATASASCLYQCSFCIGSKVAGKYRIKNPRQTVDEMIQMHKRFSHQLFFMTDSLINPVLTDLANEFIKSGVSLYYDAYFKVDDPSGDIRNTLLWRRGGLYRVRLGTESGSQRILEEMDKRITVQQIKATVSALAYAGIKTTTYWVIGHPGETEADFQQTLDLVEELKDDIFQAECNYFLVHYSQQAQADSWRKYIQLLYPEKWLPMVTFRYYTPGPGFEPSREETFKRVHRFEMHCKKLGIPNPYSYDQHVKADERWQRLHKNAVPSLLDFLRKTGNISENINIKNAALALNQRQDEGDFNF
ncbi:MAG TPA: B12-binding domain-containing radical SAM protein [Candidatus Kapabacteria bacterium]|nr:B12-binding domain-containing radical SAM protein [Candidatus Kapabacteria bacterium]